ncbi:MAG: DNA adenine methylase [Candidatus Viridilinea halotolerans]|uniref:DNA adenine methylase n=1 Tax=Candidatus Viridilinea halotolerans TaxID=2491704 RepID=A0A426U5X5_9CHLR|nr:MAG: DNA adenine methylase [Candidatus Viridilinea halotolerans]
MEQLTFLAGHSSPHCSAAIVNVATVPQRSPFRYPGGKTWLVPRIRAWLGSLPTQPVLYIEPFAGGGIVSLTVAFEQLAERVLMVELDPQVAAVWRTILEGDAEELAQAIISFDMRLETLTAAVQREPATVAECAFQTILKNRTNRGGILAPGAGRINHGENGKGIRSRWYPETISRRIRDIVQHRGRLTFIEGDGVDVCRQYAADKTVVFFIDPPYTASTKRAGSRLYRYSEIDHQELFRIASTFAGDFLMTYDNAEELRALAANFGFDTELVAMKNTHHTAMTELLIGRNLDWVRHTLG